MREIVLAQIEVIQRIWYVLKTL